MSYTRSHDFVPEPFPRPEQAWETDEALFMFQEAARVQECLSCGQLCDGDGPTVCPDCEDYMTVLPGAVWDPTREGVCDE